MKRNITHSNDQDLPKEIINGTEATTFTRTRRKKIVYSEQIELNGSNPPLQSIGEKSKQISSDKNQIVNGNESETTENEVSLESNVVTKEFQIKLFRCDENDASDVVTYSKQLDEIKPMPKTKQKRLKISSRKNMKKMKDSSEATGNIQKNEDFDMCSALGVIVDNKSNQIDEIKSKSRAVLKKLKNLKVSEAENSFKPTKDAEKDENKIPKSKTVVKIMKNTKGNIEGPNSSEAIEDIIKPKSKTEVKILRNTKEDIEKPNSSEAIEDARGDIIKPKSKAVVKILRNIEGLNSSEAIEDVLKDKIKPKSKTAVKILRNTKGNIEEQNSSDSIDVLEDEIKPKSNITEKKLKISKGENSLEVTESIQKHEDKKTKSKSVVRKLKGSIKTETIISKEADNLEKDEDFELCNASRRVGKRSRQVDKINSNLKNAQKKLKNSKESIKKMNKILKVTETVQKDENFELCIASDKVSNSSRQVEEINSKSLTMMKQLESSKESKKEMAISKATESDKKDKNVELCNESDKVNILKQEDERKPKFKISVKKLKNSKSIKKSKIPKASENLQPADEIPNNDITKEVLVINEKHGVQESIETLKSGDSELHVDVTEKIKNVPNETAKGNSKRKREKQSEDTKDDERPTKSTKKEKDSSKSKNVREKIPDVTSIDFSNDSKTPSGNAWNFKISSWNTNGIRAWLEKNGLSYVHHEKPDVICIQETKCSDDKLPEEIKKIEGYHTYWLSGDKDGYSGVGLLSKQEPIKVEYGIDISEHDNEGRVITAEYEKFYLVAAYVPNAGRKLVRLEYRMKWDEDFRAYIKKLDTKKPVILCGDLNVAHEEIDLANPKTNKKNAGFTKEEREGFSALLKEGFTDTFRQLYPDLTGAYTFWTYMMNARNKNVGWRLDYFVISDRFCENLCDNVIRKDVLGSDHCPITLFLSL